MTIVLTKQQIVDFWNALPPLPFVPEPTEAKCTIYAIDVPEGERSVREKAIATRVEGKKVGKRTGWLFESF